MHKLLSILSDSAAAWARNPPASKESIDELIKRVDFFLPEEYLMFLRYSNGGGGVCCIEPWWFQICPAEEVIEYNRGYEVETYLPEYFAIGSNGAGDMLVIRKRDSNPCPVYMVPFIGMSK